MSSGDEGQKRRDNRLTINKEFGSFDAFIAEYVTNISRTGAFVKTPDPPPVEIGAIVQVGSLPDRGLAYSIFRPSGVNS